jgi:hypothetical protein
MRAAILSMTIFSGFLASGIYLRQSFRRTGKEWERGELDVETVLLDPGSPR